MRLDVRSDIKQVLRMLNETQRQIVPKVASRSLNKTITTVNAEAARLIKMDLGSAIAISTIKANIRKINATPKKLYVALYAKGGRIPLIKLDPQAKQNAIGVTYKNNSRGRITIPHAFIAAMRNGHRGIFKRQGSMRLPIEELAGASIPKVFVNDVILKAMEHIAKERWTQTFQHELEYELKKFK